jgi:DNA/RNA-binding domain of Phe-tRNA-synthetase-like protein
LRAGAILCRDVTIGESPESLRREIRAAAADVRQRFGDAGALRLAPQLSAFRRIHEAVGANPRREPPACERLVEYAWKRGDLPTVNSLVDAYNLVSLRRLLSLGAHDLSTLSLPVQLRMVRGGETFTPLGGYRGRHPQMGEFAYVDAAERVICRLDVVQADFSKVTPDTTDALLIVQATAWHERPAIEAGWEEVGALVTQYCGGSIEVVARPFGEE